MKNQLSRRRLMSTFAGFAAAAAINPFPKIVPALAQDSTPATDQPAAAENQVLRWVGGETFRLAQWDYSGWIFQASQNVYMTPFVQLDSGDIAAGVCSDYTVSDDLLTYTFHVNSDAVWSDASKITASDIKFSWEYMANPELSQNVFNYYQTQAVLGNADVYSGKTTDMVGLQVLDDSTLQITLSEPYTPFIYYCTHNLMAPHQQENIENGGVDWDKVPTVASGPFMVESFDVNSGAASLVQNPNWWGTTPTLERIEIIAVPDESSRLLAWTSDECEVWQGGGSSDYFQQFGDAELIAHPIGGNAFFLLNTQQSPTDDIHVRRALQRATDVQTMTAALWNPYTTDVQSIVGHTTTPIDLRTSYIPATGITHPTDPAFVERPYLFDVEEAKAELAQSSYAEGTIPPIIAMMSGNDQIKQATILQQMWKDHLGIDLQIIAADQATAAESSGANLFLSGNHVLYVGPGGLLSWGWHSGNYHFNGKINTVDDEVESLLSTGDETPDSELNDRVAAYVEAENLIIDRGYLIPLFWSPVAIPVKSRVARAALNATTNPDFTQWYITAE